MKYKVNGFNNFCRVFLLPDSYPSGYCFGGGIPVQMRMVDWFYPCPGLSQWAISRETYEELVKEGTLKRDEIEVYAEEIKATLLDFLNRKKYTVHGAKYLVLCNFGLDFTFICDKNN